MLKPIEIKQAIAKLENNEIIILPTDTIYGLSAQFNFENKIKINQLKSADLAKPLILLISNLEQVNGLAILNDKTIKLLNSELPITVIVPGIESLAIRLVKRNDLKEIIDIVGPIYSTSVNFHGQKPLMEKVDLEQFDSTIQVFWDQPLNSNPSKIFDAIKGEWVR